MIRLLNASFSYGYNKVIIGVDLHVKKGEYIALLGNNGSGKTTLGRLIKGLLTPVSGKRYYRDNDVTDEGINNNIGYIFSNSENQIVSPIIEEDVAFGPENQGGDSLKIVSSVNGALETLNISSLKNSLSHNLSGGELQKVLISGIIAMKVSCIIFDEATAMLDPSEREVVCKLLQRLNSEQGITIINITHMLDEILDSGRVIILRDGKIVFDDSPASLLTDIDIIKTVGLLPTSFATLVSRLINDGTISQESIGAIKYLADQIARKKISKNEL